MKSSASPPDDIRAPVRDEYWPRRVKRHFDELAVRRRRAYDAVGRVVAVAKYEKAIGVIHAVPVDAVDKRLRGVAGAQRAADGVDA